jgi:multidrug efflux pump subunit AcrB
MNISEPFIRRPVGTSLLAAGVLILGAVSYHFLPVAPLPKVDYPTINVSAQEPGVDPQTAASSLAAPLERRFAQIAGVSEITSVSSLGGSSIRSSSISIATSTAQLVMCKALITAAGNTGGLPITPRTASQPIRRADHRSWR